VDGLIRRITYYKDIRRIKPLEVEELYYGRKDKLVRRLKYPVQSKCVESFSCGRPDALKEIEEIAGVQRTLLYFSTSRLDGLEKTIEDIGTKITEYFVDRDDRMTYHSLKMTPFISAKMGKVPTVTIEGLGDFAVVKMTLKFSQDGGEGFLNHNPLFKKVVFHPMDEGGKIRVDLHGSSTKIRDDSSWYVKDESVLRPLNENQQDSLRAQDLVDLLTMEKSAKTGWQEMISTKLYPQYGTRKKEEQAVRLAGNQLPGAPNAVQVLEKTVYDVAREKASSAIAKDAARNSADNEGDEAEKSGTGTTSGATIGTGRSDFLARYLVDFGGKPLDALQAEFVAKKVKNDFRKRLLDRAQIIQRRLEEEQENLKKKRSQMQRRGGENVEKDERIFEQYQSNAMFRIQILEQRLARHETHAVKKFVELENALAEDPRLGAMWQKK